MSPVYTVDVDEDINSAVIRVTGAPANWVGDGHHVNETYVFTGHVLGDTITVFIDKEGEATFTVS